MTASRTIHRPQSQFVMWGIPAHAEPRKETIRYATQYIAAARGCANRRNLDSRFPETVELHCCHLSHCIWHSRVDQISGKANERIWLEKIVRRMRIIHRRDSRVDPQVHDNDVADEMAAIR